MRSDWRTCAHCGRPRRRRRSRKSDARPVAPDLPRFGLLAAPAACFGTPSAAGLFRPHEHGAFQMPARAAAQQKAARAALSAKRGDTPKSEPEHASKSGDR